MEKLKHYRLKFDKSMSLNPSFHFKFNPVAHSHYFFRSILLIRIANLKKR